MFKLSYKIVGMFFKECRWTIEKSQTIMMKPNPVELEKWQGHTERVRFFDKTDEIEKFYIYDTIFGYKDCMVEVNVKPLDRGDQQSIFYHNPHISTVNRVY